MGLWKDISCAHACTVWGQFNMDCDESLVKAQTTTQTHTDSTHQDQEELNLYAGREGTW